MKNKIIKITSLMLCLVLCLSLCSCSMIDTISSLFKPQYCIVEDISLGYTQMDISDFTYSEHYTPYKNKDSYDLLENDKMRALYDLLYQNVYYVYPQAGENGEYKTKQAVLEESNLSEAQVRLTIKALTDDNPQIFWLSSTFGFLLHSEYNYTAVQLYSRYSPDELALRMKELKEKVNSFYLSLDSDMSEFARELEIHDYILKNCEYDESVDFTSQENYEKTDAFDVYGALVNGVAVCEGYSRAFELLCNGVGIRCINLIGTSQDELHMWSAVVLDGDWYYVDTTWDDIEDKAFMYDYFNINEKQLKKDHEFSAIASEMTDEQINGDGDLNALTSNFYIPKCDNTAFNYYVRKSAHLTNYDGKEVVNSLLKAATDKEDYFHFYIDPDEFTYDYAVDSLFYSYPQYFFNYISTVNESLSDYSIDTSSLSLYKKESLSVVTVVLDYV